VIAAIVVAAVVAAVVVATGGDDDDGNDVSATAEAFDTATAEVEGAGLPAFAPAGADPAIGMEAPTATGVTPDGATVTMPTEGRPTMMVFLAHWCPHCQKEIVEAQEWIEEGNVPDEVDVVGVSTAIDPTRPNHPPSAWFEKEGWTSPTIGDASLVVGEAYGLTEFPYWVTVDADGRVVDRRVGEQTDAGFAEMAALAQG
jgi:thiol-disulfide isomerase/thioredoxin